MVAPKELVVARPQIPLLENTEGIGKHVLTRSHGGVGFAT